MNTEEMLKRLQAGESPLEVSIQKWKDIVEGIGIDLAQQNCALCQIYYKYQHCDPCAGCPVELRSGKPKCINTPYSKYVEAKGKNSIEEKMYAQQELDFLISLRPKPIEPIYKITCGYCQKEMVLPKEAGEFLWEHSIQWTLTKSDNHKVIKATLKMETIIPKVSPQITVGDIYYSRNENRFFQIRGKNNLSDDIFICGGFTEYYDDAKTSILVQTVDQRYITDISVLVKESDLNSNNVYGWYDDGTGWRVKYDRI